MDSGERLVARTREVCEFLLQHRERLELKKIIVYGSLARGTFDHLSDVDIMLIVGGDFHNADRINDILLSEPEFFNTFKGGFPLADVHTCSEQSYYDDAVTNSGTVFGGYLAAIKEEGIIIWER